MARTTSVTTAGRAQLMLEEFHGPRGDPSHPVAAAATVATRPALLEEW